MNLSDARKSRLYDAIHEPIMDERIRFKGHEELDEKLFELELEIWRRVKVALNITD